MEDFEIIKKRFIASAVCPSCDVVDRIVVETAVARLENCELSRRRCVDCGFADEFSSTEKLEVIPMITRKMEFSYMDQEDYVFSDPETFETVTLAPGLIGDNKHYLTENASVVVTFVQDKAVSIELPASVMLEVTDAPEGIKGDSANNVQKPATLETGISIQVPLFIKTGEKIKVDTRNGKYMERA